MTTSRQLGCPWKILLDSLSVPTAGASEEMEICCPYSVVLTL